MRHFKGDGYSPTVSDLHLENVVVERLCCRVWVCVGGQCECSFDWTRGPIETFEGREQKSRTKGTD